MNAIQEHREKKKEVLDQAIEILKPIMKRLKKDEKIIGEQLSRAIGITEFEQRRLGICPVCKTGKLIVTYSTRTGKRFIGCTNYFKNLCSASFPLPQSGTLLLNNRKCLSCGWPTVQLRMRRYRRILCLNPECPSKKGRAENLRCVICSKESRECGYCQFHLKARKNIVANYEQWKRTLNISWKEYLSEIAKNPLAGAWVKEVAQHLMSEGEQTDVKKRQEERF